MNSVFTNQDTVYKAAFNALNCGIILLDNESRILCWNTWVVRHSGIPEQLALTHQLDFIFYEGLSKPFKSALKNALTYPLPIILSNALHHSPLPLYANPLSNASQERIQQSISITPIMMGEKHFCLLQITDASLAVKRESMLKATSERLGKEASVDALTGAYNRRFFNSRYVAELGRAKRQQTPISLLIVDIDFFKNYNDSYGHPAGDKVLIAVVQALKSQLNRHADMVVRYGGEEFTVLLPDADAVGCQAIAEKIRAAVEELNLPHSDSAIAGHITVSIGTATCELASSYNHATLLEAADSALYKAKNGGRNCVVHTFA